MKYNTIVQELLKYFPEFKESPDFKPISNQQDLPYIVFGAFQYFYENIFKKNDKNLLKRMSTFLEEMALSELKVQELLAYGFLENFDKSTDYYEEMINTFGPHTKKQLEDVDEFWKRYEESQKKS